MKIFRFFIVLGIVCILGSGWGLASTLTELPPLSTPTVTPSYQKNLPESQKKPSQEPGEEKAVEPEKGNVPTPQTPGEKTETETEIKPGAQPQVQDQHPDYPFYPSLIKVDGQTPVSLDKFLGAPECGVCHKQIYQQWKGSMHAAAFTDPIWRKLVALGSEETDGKTDKLCIGCHTPIGLATDDVKDVPGIFSEDTDLVSTFGVQCDACHVMSESHGKTPFGEPGNGSFTLSPGPIKRGPYEDCDAGKIHEGLWSSLHVTSLICANCHQSFHGNFPVERTYDEWKKSVYARKGIQCQHCHMMPVEKAVEAARTLIPPEISGPASELKPDRSPFFPHWFLGANSAMAGEEGFQEHAREIMHRLQTAASMELEVSDAVVTPGRLIKLKVKVINVAAGHNLPTSLPELRQMWLNVHASDQDGRVFFHSGDVTAEGAIEKNARIFDAYSVDANGQHTIKPWKIDHFLWNRTIPPKGMAVETFTIMIPKGIKKEVRFSVKLRYRSYPQSLVNQLLKEKTFKVPVVDMVEKRIVLPVVSE